MVQYSKLYLFLPVPVIVYSSEEWELLWEGWKFVEEHAEGIEEATASISDDFSECRATQARGAEYTAMRK
jgi:hypothetical protein